MWQRWNSVGAILEIHTQKKKKINNLNLRLMAYTEMDSKWLIDLNEKVQP